MDSRRNQPNQLKQWRQEWKVTTRKLDQSEKAYLKALSSFADMNPEASAKTHLVLAEHDSMGKKSQKQSVGVYGKLKKINDSIDELREILKYFDKTNESLLKVQKASEGIFGKMEAMKTDMANSYDELDDLERKLSSDLELMERRIEGFDDEEVCEAQPSHPLPRRVKNKENLSVENKAKGARKSSEVQQLPLEPKSEIQILEEKMRLKQEQVEKVEEEIRELGKNLGWHEEDHKDFLTIWNRNQGTKNYFEIQEELTEYFKMYTGEQIVEHMNKHMKLKKLNDRKKVLISDYKQLKEDRKAEEIAKLQSNQEERQRQARREEELRRQEQEQKEMKGKVEMWKKQKEEAKLEEARRAAEDEQRRKNEQTAARREEESKRRQLMEKWREEREQKEKEKEKEQERKPARPHSAVNKQTRQRIREREEQIIKQKMERAIERKMQEEELAKKAERIREQKMIKYAHVGSKLEEKTTAIKEKEREKFDGKEKKEANTFGGQLLLTGVRAVPSWRQGL